MNDLQSAAAQMMGTHARRVFSFVNEYHHDPELRARCESDPHGVLAEHGVEVPLGYDLRFVADTADVHHFVLPPDPNASLEDKDLDMVVGGGKYGAARSTHYFDEYSRRYYRYEYDENGQQYMVWC